MTVQFTLDASGIGGTIIPGGSTPRKVVGSDGTITVSSIDAASFLQAGAYLLNTRVVDQALPAAPVAATAGRIVASAALSNGTLSIANQPDVARQILVRVDPGGAAITAGDVALTYVGNDGTVHVDHISAVTPISTVKSTASSMGVVSLTSAIVTALVGGSSPKIQINDTNSLSMLVQPHFSAFTMVQMAVDGSVASTSAVASSAASYTPSTAPNGTHTYSAVAQYNGR